MKRQTLVATVVCLALLSAPLSQALGRGFGGGGGRGGGFGGGARGGNFGGGGGYRGGNFGGGNFGGGGYRGGSFGGGNFSGGRGNYGGGNFAGGGNRGNVGSRTNAGGAGRENFAGNAGRENPAGGGGRGGFDFAANSSGLAGRNGAPSRGKVDSFLGLPSDEGFHNFGGNAGGNFDVNRGAVEGPRGGVAAGATVTGPRGNTAGKGVAVGPDGGVAAGRGVKGADGADGAKAGQGVVAGPNGRVAAGSAVRGPNGYGGARGIAAGPRGVAAGFTRTTPVGRYSCGAAVRSGFNDWGIYGHGWYGNHPGAWYAAGWAAGSAWNSASWYGLSDWFGYGEDYAPVYYDYGNNVTYDDGTVYVNGEEQGSAGDYYEQAQAIADTGTQAEASTDGDWLPLGVFVLSRVGHDHSKVVIQLAVNKEGTLRGNYTDTLTDNPMPVHGSVDKKTQRVAFTVGSKDTTVFETGLDNLTKDEAPILIHFGTDRTEQWLLVRMQQPADGEQADSNPDDSAPAESDDPAKDGE